MYSPGMLYDCTCPDPVPGPSNQNVRGRGSGNLQRAPLGVLRQQAVETLVLEALTSAEDISIPGWAGS